MSGALDLLNHVTAVGLFVDVNGDGLLDVGDTAIPANPVISPGSVSFENFSETILASASTTWLVTFDLDATVPIGLMFQAYVAQDSDVTVTGSLTPSPLVAGSPVAGGMKLVSDAGSIAVMPVSGIPWNGVAYPGESDVPVLCMRLQASSVEPVAVTSLICTGAAIGDGNAEITGVYLYRDVDGDGQFNPSTDALLAGPELYGANGKTTFHFFWIVGAATTEWFFVVYDFGASVPVGMEFQAGLAANNEVAATGILSGKAVTIAGAPILGGVYTIVSEPRCDVGGCCPGNAADSPLPGLTLLLLAFVVGLGLARRRVVGS
jgi:hypothetical protein